jgi:hypothetical protein
VNKLEDASKRCASDAVSAASISKFIEKKLSQEHLTPGHRAETILRLLSEALPYCSTLIAINVDKESPKATDSFSLMYLVCKFVTNSSTIFSNHKEHIFMEEICSWFSLNYEWIFSGIGVFVVSGIAGLMYVRSKATRVDSNKVTQKNIRSGGDVVGRDKK